jgi:hypothetical protein
MTDNFASREPHRITTSCQWNPDNELKCTIIITFPERFNAWRSALNQAGVDDIMIIDKPKDMRFQPGELM